jgi:cell wall-associated NlpC family hydrolase
MENVTGRSLIEAARRYLGVPYKHKGRDHDGLDCAGLVLRSAIDAGITHLPKHLPNYEPTVNSNVLIELVRSYTEPILRRGEGQAGDILVLSTGHYAGHMGFLDLTPTPLFIHSVRETPGCVIVQEMTGLLWGRVIGVHRLIGVSRG